MEFLKWLSEVFGGKPDTPVLKEAAPVKKASPAAKKAVATGGFIDEETGKVYKTAGALKGAQTRRKNKAKKAKK